MRFPDLKPDEMTAEQRQVHDEIASGPRGQVGGPLRVWLNSPQMASRAQALGQYARYDSVLTEDQSELIILITARIWSSGYEWAHHEPIARSVGVRDATIDAIAHARRPDVSGVEAAIFEMTVELHRDRWVNEETFKRAENALGKQGCVDLVAICGYYTLISMSINAFLVPDGQGPKLPKLNMPVAEYFRD